MNYVNVAQERSINIAMGGNMEYDKGLTDHEIQRHAAAFQSAIDRKLGKHITQEDTLEVIKALNKELKTRIQEEHLRVTEDTYGWMVYPPYGHAGEVYVLKPKDLA